MEFIKLQVGCFIIYMYILILYMKQINSVKKRKNIFFTLLLVIVPFTIIFDATTSWTVNHLDKVPLTLNLILHGIYYFSINTTIFLYCLYVLSITTYFPKNWFKRILVVMPYLVAIIMILLFTKDTKFLQASLSNYSCGYAASTCYTSALYYFFFIFFLVLFHRNSVSKRKQTGIFLFLIISFFIIILQSIIPDSLLLSVDYTVFLIGMYISMEDPALARLEEYNKDMVENFATLVENRDNSTGGHIKRTQGYVNILLKNMSKSPIYKKILTKDFQHYMDMAAPMHDIGKISTPDHILQKPGKLTDEEYAIMKQHASRGGEIIQETFANLNEPEFLRFAYNVARFHHEKWDGSGYPDKLMGTDIPLAARIMAIADVFDAVSAKRCYRDALPLETCFKIIEEGSGTAFEPVLVDLFLKSKKEVIDLYSQKF